MAMNWTRRSVLECGALAALATVMPRRGAAATARGFTLDRPNLLLIEADDLRWDALGCTGNPIARTPHLDGLATDGVLFSNTVCQGAECVPSRHSLLTGSYPHNNGVHTNACDAISPQQWTFPKALQRAGYDTALFGKNHLHPIGVPRSTPRIDFRSEELVEGWKALGFDEVHALHGKRALGLGKGQDEYAQYLEDRGLLAAVLEDYQPRFEGTRLVRNHVSPSPLEEEDTADAFVSRLFRGWLDQRRRKKPFFAWLSLLSPHLPCDAPRSFVEQFRPEDMPEPITPVPGSLTPSLEKKASKAARDTSLETGQQIRASYHGMVSLLDSSVGAVLQGLEDLGLSGNTVVVFTSDQGHQLGDHGIWSKGVFYRSTITTPTIVAWPGRIDGAREVTLPVERQDLVPTLLELADARAAEYRYPEGESLSPLLLPGGEYRREDAFAEKGDAKMIIHGDHKYVHRPDEAERQLFDLSTDPEERHNLAGDPAHAARETELRERLLDWLATSYAIANTHRERSAQETEAPAE